MMASSLAEIVRSRGVKFVYQASDGAALHDVDMDVAAGEVVVLCGGSGCGKTTYTRLLNGLVPGLLGGELSGEHMTCGLQAGTSSIEAYVPLVGSVFQNPKTQYFNANVSDEMAFPCENSGMDSDMINARIHEVAQRYGVDMLLDRDVSMLSGGQRQQLAVATAMMLDPKLVVMDEPTGNLDQAAIGRLHDMVVALKRDGVTVVIAEHRLAWCMDVADRFIIIEDGAATQEYTAVKFRALPAEQVEALGLRGLDMTPYQVAIRQKIVAGNEENEEAASSPLIATQELRVGVSHRRWFGRRSSKKTAQSCDFAKDIDDFALHSGQIVGLMGCNGAGKSTLARTLCGLQRPLAGRIMLEGKPATRTELTDASFLVMQDVNYQLFADSVRGELLMGQEEETSEQWEALRQRCDDILQSLDLLQFADRHPMTLSGGQKQRLAIAVALMCGKRLIVFDEPTSGLDHAHMMQVGSLLRSLADSGKAVLVITHDEELAARWCDRIFALPASA